VKAGFMSLEFGFDKRVGERGADRRQIRIALPILRGIVLAFILRDIAAAGDAFTLDYAVALFIVCGAWSRAASNAGPGYSCTMSALLMNWVK